MSAAVLLTVMSSSFFNPSFAFSSHFDTDGAPLSELSWSSSLAVVAVSFSGLFTFIFLMLACLCCKKGDIGFKEFENTEAEEYQTDHSALGTPASQAGHDVYVLPLTEVSHTVSKQPGRSVQLLKSSDLGRHSLLYLKEIGHGWFGKILLGEVNAGPSTTQVVVKELKASASVQDQMQFLEEVQPYRTLQHPALVQCLAQCSEITPYLLVMEYCPLGDVKGYLRSCRAAESLTPEPLILQRMACEIASGLLHLHKYNYIHSDLALRNCLLTSELTVKIGDYGLSHTKYKDDYFVTPDQLWVPLRWISPEIIDEVHGNLLMVDQTKASNVWSLGVTIWELFELGNQPYRHYSDRQVLAYAVKEQQLKLPKPQIKMPLSERWYEVMQFCWLQPDQRPTAEEVHLLLGYLCTKSTSKVEEDFEKHWSNLRSGSVQSDSHSVSAVAVDIDSCASSSFPLLEHFYTNEDLHAEPGDDILTVTETSHGLNFEYKWEQMRSEQPYCSSKTSGPLGESNPDYQDVYYPTRNSYSSCGEDRTSMPLYKSKEFHTPGVVPVLSAHSPSVSSEYYIRIEEPVECNINLDYSTSDCSPGFEGSNSSFVADSGDSGNCPAAAQSNSYWSADPHKASIYDSDISPAISPTMEPLLSKSPEPSPGNHWRLGERLSYKNKEEEDVELLDSTRMAPDSWDSETLSHPLEELGSPLELSPSLNSPKPGYCESMEGAIKNRTARTDFLPKAKPVSCAMSIDIEMENTLITGILDSNSGEGKCILSSHWDSNCSSNNNSLNFDCKPHLSCVRNSHCSMTDQKDAWAAGTEDKSILTFNPKHFSHIDATTKDNDCIIHEIDTNVAVECKNKNVLDIHFPQFTDQPFAHVVSKQPFDGCIEKNLETSSQENKECPSLPSTISIVSLLTSQDIEKKPNLWKEDSKCNPALEKDNASIQRTDLIDCEANTEIPTMFSENNAYNDDNSEQVSENSHTGDSLLEVGCSSISIVDTNDCSDDDDDDDDLTDVTSGIMADFVDVAEVGGDVSVSVRSFRRLRGTPDSTSSIEIPSVNGSCEALSPASFCPSTQPKALDSGYDTENNESPEFILKEPSESSDQEGKAHLIGSPVLGDVESEMFLQVDLDTDTEAVVSLSTSRNSELQLTALNDKNPYRDSAYFSDYDNENDRWSREEDSNILEKIGDGDFTGQDAEMGDISMPTGTEPPSPQNVECEKHKNENISDVSGTVGPEASSSVPVFSTFSPSPPEMGGCLTKEEPSQDEGLGLETENSGEEQASECSSSTISINSSTQQEYSTMENQIENSPAKDLTIREVLHKDEWVKKNIDCSAKQSEKRLPDASENSSVVVPIADGEEADEEDADSEDSEESDDELCCYNVQEQSEDSEDDCTAVPVVVSDSSDAKHLRSLLKMPTLLTESFCDDLDRKKKAVSFFDDVTVYLFDQESPTRDLAEPGFPSEEGPSKSIPSEDETHSQEVVSISDDSSDGNVSEEGAGFEWEDDFPLISTVTPTAESVPTLKTPEAKPDVLFSRFSGTRFSITHVSDSDVESIGGSSEDGE